MKIRSFLTIAFMYFYGFVMIAAGSGAQYNGGVTLFTWVVGSFIAAIVVWGIWNLELRVRERPTKLSQTDNIEKRKRERLDSVIRDLSDEDLLRLRRRLLDGTIDDSHLESALLGEDGEIVYGGKR